MWSRFWRICHSSGTTWRWKSPNMAYNIFFLDFIRFNQTKNLSPSTRWEDFEYTLGFEFDLQMTLKSWKTILCFYRLGIYAKISKFVFFTILFGHILFFLSKFLKSRSYFCVKVNDLQKYASQVSSAFFVFPESNFKYNILYDGH